MLDIIRILVCIPFLLYACHLDLKMRKVPNRTWHLMILIGIMLASVDILNHGTAPLIRFALSVSFLSAFAYILFRIKALGGADAKAIIAISVVVPSFPFVPLRGIPFLNLFAFSVFGNAILLTLIVPLLIFVYNLMQLSRDEIKEKPLYLFLGYKSKISELKKHIKLIESYAEQDGDVVRRFVYRGVDVDDEIMERLQQLAKDGKIPDEVWVTPGLPFMISLTLGFITALVYGDLMYLITSHLLCMLQSNPYLAFDGFFGSLTQSVNL